MNKVRIIPLLATALLLAIAGLLAACTAEINEPGGTAADVLTDVTFTLTPEVPQEVETRTSTVVKNQINSFYILQYSADGTTQLQEPQYFSKEQLQLPDFTTNYVVKAGTLVNQPSMIYLVVNARTDLRGEDLSTVALLEAYSRSIREEDALLHENIVMTGLYVGKPQAKMNIPLTRAIAKATLNLSVSLPAGHSFTLSSVQVKQVPNKMHHVRNDLNTTPYPALAAGEPIDYPAATYTDQDLATTPASIEWYLPENCRGTGTATSELDKNATTAPAGQAAFCTYLEIKGKYNSGTNWVGKLDVAYRIYLGGNNTNDYNLRRNTNYTVNTVIKGANRADTRITVTGTENAATYLDYTDNFTPWMAVATADATTSSIYWGDWMIDIDTGTGADGSPCPAGWRTPSIEELMLMYVYNRSVAGITNSNYLTNHEYRYFTFHKGTADMDSNISRGGGRCVRDI